METAAFELDPEQDETWGIVTLFIGHKPEQNQRLCLSCIVVPPENLDKRNILDWGDY